jgi:hypothetical protein
MTADLERAVASGRKYAAHAAGRRAVEAGADGPAVVAWLRANGHADAADYLQGVGGWADAAARGWVRPAVAR